MEETVRKIKEETLNDKGTLLPGGQMALLLGLGAADPAVGSGTRMVEVALGSGVSDSWAVLWGGFCPPWGVEGGSRHAATATPAGEGIPCETGSRFHSLSISRAL